MNTIGESCYLDSGMQREVGWANRAPAPSIQGRVHPESETTKI